MNEFKSPLSIYVLWHEDYKPGQQYADCIYSTFCRDVNDPVDRGTGIPVYFRSVCNAEGCLAPIPFEEADRNAVIILGEMNMYNSDVWENFIPEVLDRQNELNALYKTSKVRLFPVALDELATLINPELSESLFIDLVTETEEEEVSFETGWPFLKRQLLHELARVLFDKKAAARDFESDQEVSPPVKLFLSHAHLDGKNLANKLDLHVKSKGKLKTFIDTKDISYGEKIKKEITRYLHGNTVVIAFQTDEYASRDWCVAEVILAKRLNATVVTVFDIKKGERRSFPYLGNGPTIRWAENCDEIIDIALTQVVRRRFWVKKLEAELEAYRITKYYHTHILGQAPELLDFVRFNEKVNDEDLPQLVVYPEPPLGFEESRLLNELDPVITFTTAISLPSFQSSNKSS